ncbi:hypothetical protein P4O66_016447, partial [Electrophorus voltai]
MNSPTRMQQESETIGGSCSDGTKLRLFPSLLHLSVTKPEAANPLALRVHGHLVILGKSRVTFILMTMRSQVSAKSLPILTNAAGGSGLHHKMVTQLVPVANPQATQPAPVPVPGVRDATRPDPGTVLGMRDAARPVTRSVPVTTRLDLPLLKPTAAPSDPPPLYATAAPPDPPVSVPGVEEVNPRAPVPRARPVPVPCARLVPLVAPQSPPAASAHGFPSILPPACVSCSLYASCVSIVACSTALLFLPSPLPGFVFAPVVLSVPIPVSVSPFVSIPVPVRVSVLVPMSVFVPGPLSLA